MAALPAEDKTAGAIFGALQSRLSEPPRAHLGASVLGRPCIREIWYGFRWALDGQHSGRLLRLFRRGQLEEAQLVADLRAAGVDVMDRDPTTRDQWTWRTLDGHAGGSADGIGLGFPESPDKWHLLEFKTHNEKSFKALAKSGVETAKPEHYAQIQVLMYWSGRTDSERLTRAMYIAVNKNTDEIYTERVKYHGPTAKTVAERAEIVLRAAEPPIGLNDWHCKMCSAKALCHEQSLPAVNCRTCAHATPEMGGDARWSCAYHDKDLTVDEQRAGCPHHVYIPAFISFAEYQGGNEAENWAAYKMEDGRVFRNGSRGPLHHCYTSKELRALDPSMIRNETVDALRVQFDATVEPVEDYPVYNDAIPF